MKCICCLKEKNEYYSGLEICEECAIKMDNHIEDCSE